MRQKKKPLYPEAVLSDPGVKPKEREVLNAFLSGQHAESHGFRSDGALLHSVDAVLAKRLSRQDFVMVPREELSKIPHVAGSTLRRWRVAAFVLECAGRVVYDRI